MLWGTNFGKGRILYMLSGISKREAKGNGEKGLWDKNPESVFALPPTNQSGIP
jgi:hypothetical protein